MKTLKNFVNLFNGNLLIFVRSLKYKMKYEIEIRMREMGLELRIKT